ncbi:TRAP-type C4-dicarboxylate transport system permease small subunit [Cricetibacter osteomyelitidis]|uniref:TRAP transporter small permease protein n=1 Tax=Cricetibacter osteomyelitidis TaxID=1521931 RepID=A0A4R2T128_9PAST|nr:TRAP transporter small permease [Cricetibacter osteomyelitidis]TCP96579.1 TRAP-type C4-dicarboxylate transport system permease small subunit [Cricetibacter osteomyelitidis]
MLLLVKKIVDKIMALLCIAIVLSMCVLVTYQVITRYIFNSPSAVSEVLARYLFIWLVLFGGAYVFGLREHMSISFIKQKFSNKVQIYLDMFSELVIAMFSLSIMILGGYNITVRQMFQMDSALQLPVGVIYSAIPVSGVIILFYFIHNEIMLFRKLKDS